MRAPCLKLSRRQCSCWLAGLILAAVLAGCSKSHEGLATVAPVPSETKPPPNLLVVVVDDMGYSDIGAFGGEIPTPTLDRLARQGTRFSDFQVLPACSPTRAALLTGQEPHAVGFGSLAEELADNQKGTPAYRGALPSGVPTIASLLQAAGYRTYLSGKWHLGGDADPGPQALGFDESVVLMSGGASHFVDMKPAYSPDPEAVAPYAINGESLSRLPGNFEYSSQFFADELIRMVGQGSDSPFFALLSFTAPHWPLQAPDAAIAAFEETYGSGYEVLRAQRLQGLKHEGLVPPDTPPSELPPKVKPWASLSPEAQHRERRAMAVYAAMISEIDRHTGRVIDHLEAIGAMENTVVVFFSDNGAEGHDLDETWPADLFPAIRAVIDQRFDHSTGQMGRPNSYTLYGAGWAHAAAPHLRLYKAFTSEGGTRVTAFIRLPEGERQSSIRHEMVGVRDILPTLLDLAGVPVSADSGAVLAGRSLVSLLSPSELVSQDWSSRELVVEFLGKLSVREGQWKLVKLPPPYGSGQFALYDLSVDLAERDDVSSRHPQVVERLLRRYVAYQERYGVIEPDWVSGY